jgi:hypothetical protein
MLELRQLDLDGNVYLTVAQGEGKHHAGGRGRKCMRGDRDDDGESAGAQPTRARSRRWSQDVRRLPHVRGRVARLSVFVL